MRRHAAGAGRHHKVFVRRPGLKLAAAWAEKLGMAIKLRSRGLAGMRLLALREFSLGIEALALESDSVDPRL